MFDINASPEQEKSEQEKAIRTARYQEYLEMSSHDKFRIYNPTEEDFFIEWGGVKHLVPNRNRDMGYGAGQMRVERFLMAWYCKHMTDKIINDINNRKLALQLERFEKANPNAVLDPYEINQKVNSKVEIKLDDLETRKKIVDIINLGMEEKYGTLDNDSRLFDQGGQNDINKYAESKVFDPSQQPIQSAMIPPTKKGDELPVSHNVDIEGELGIKPTKTKKPSADEV